MDTGMGKEKPLSRGEAPRHAGPSMQATQQKQEQERIALENQRMLQRITQARPVAQALSAASLSKPLLAPTPDHRAHHRVLAVGAAEVARRARGKPEAHIALPTAKVSRASVVSLRCVYVFRYAASVAAPDSNPTTYCSRA